MPRILRLPVFSLADLSELGLEPLMRSDELGLELGWIPARIAREHLLVIRHHFVPVFLDVTDRDLDLLRAELKRGCNEALPQN
jgi:hypothetical protein